MGTPGGRRSGGSLESARLADMRKTAAAPAEGRAGTRFGGYGRGERSRGFAFQLSYVIAPAAGLWAEVA